MSRTPWQDVMNTQLNLSFMTRALILTIVLALIFIELFGLGAVIRRQSAVVTSEESTLIGIYKPTQVLLDSGEKIAVECSNTSNGQELTIQVEKSIFLGRTIYRCV